MSGASDALVDFHTDAGDGGAPGGPRPQIDAPDAHRRDARPLAADDHESLDNDLHRGAVVVVAERLERRARTGLRRLGADNQPPRAALERRVLHADAQPVFAAQDVRRIVVREREPLPRRRLPRRRRGRRGELEGARGALELLRELQGSRGLAPARLGLGLQSRFRLGGPCPGRALLRVRGGVGDGDLHRQRHDPGVAVRRRHGHGPREGLFWRDLRRRRRGGRRRRRGLGGRQARVERHESLLRARPRAKATDVGEAARRVTRGAEGPRVAPAVRVRLVADRNAPAVVDPALAVGQRRRGVRHFSSRSVRTFVRRRVREREEMTRAVASHRHFALVFLYGYCDDFVQHF